MNQELKNAMRSFGASDGGCAEVDDGPEGLPFAISAVVRLSDAVVDEIGGEPTYTYFNHYRSVNYLIDQLLLRTGLWLGERGARWMTVAASQSRPDSPFEGRYSHKKAACLSSLGRMGRNGLFLHRTWGPRVRLGTLFTDWEPALGGMNCPSAAADAPGSSCEGTRTAIHTGTGTHSGTTLFPAGCASCGLCVAACPAHALDGESVDVARCSAWMKKNYQHIGRGVVCGICMRVCPSGQAST